MKNKLKELKKEIPFKWRLQSAKNGRANIVAYIDSRDVQNILDEVLGAENWQDEYKVINDNLYCGISINIDGEWITKWDVGIESREQKEKGNSSDAFKRSAVKWGVGRFLYSIPILVLKTGSYKGKERPADDSGNILWSVDELNEFCDNCYKSGIFDRTKIRPRSQSKPKSNAQVKTLESLLLEIESAKSREELTAIWNENKNEFKQNKRFNDALTEAGLKFPK